MTNKEQFVNTYGEAAYNGLIASIKSGNVVDILEWFLDDYKGSVSSSFIEVEKNVFAPRAIIDRKTATNKMSRKNSFDTSWYTSAVESFWLDPDQSVIEFGMKDDLSGNEPCSTIHGLKYRFKIAIKQLKLTDSDISMHVRDINTTNPIIQLKKPVRYKNKFSVKA